MRAFPLFLIGAVVLIVLGVIASAAASGTALSVTWTTWLCASLLAYFAHLLLGLYVSDAA